MTHRFALDRLLETCIQQQADEVWLICGRKPMLRIEGNLRGLEIELLSAEDVRSVLATDIQRAVFKRTGLADFNLTFGAEKTQFHVTAARIRGDQCFAVIRRTAAPKDPQ